MLRVICLLLTVGFGGCPATITRVAPLEKVELAAIPKSLKKPCADPVPIPPGDAATGIAMDLWLTDRSSLRACGGRFRKYIGAVEARDAEQGRAGLGAAP